MGKTTKNTQNLKKHRKNYKTVRRTQDKNAKKRLRQTCLPPRVHFCSIFGFPLGPKMGPQTCSWPFTFFVHVSPRLQKGPKRLRGASRGSSESLQGPSTDSPGDLFESILGRCLSGCWIDRRTICSDAIFITRTISSHNLP